MSESIEVTRSDKEFIDNLWKMKTDNVLCDTIVKINAEKIPVHAVILASANEYFESKLDEQNDPREIVFNDYDKIFIDSVIEYCYKGILELTTENAIDVMRINRHLRIPDADAKCESILEKILSDDNCVTIWYLASGEKLRNKAEIKVKNKTLNYIQGRTKDLKRMTAREVDSIINLFKDKIQPKKDPNVKNLLDKWFELHKSDTSEYSYIADVYDKYEITIPTRYTLGNLS